MKQRQTNYYLNLSAAIRNHPHLTERAVKLKISENEIKIGAPKYQEDEEETFLVNGRFYIRQKQKQTI